MIKRQQYRGVVIVFILACLLLPTDFVQAESIPAPIILSIDLTDEKAVKPLVAGLTKSNTDVLVFLDQQFAGLASINASESATDNFYWQPNGTISEGRHILSIVSRDRTSLIQSPLSSEFEFEVAPLPAPTLLTPNENSLIGRPRPLITGLSLNDTVVHIFIDGIINGNTGKISHKSGTPNFAYQPFLNLSVGEHQARAVATDQNGRQSASSNILRFRIEDEMPAPTLFAPVVNSSSTIDQPWIVGLSKNNSKIRVYIDHQLNGEFLIDNNSSGTANFAYQPFLPMSEGNHLIYATAVDEQGKESRWSDLIYYNVATVALPRISESAATDEEPIVMGDAKLFSDRLPELIALARLFAANNEIVINEEQLLELQSLLQKEDELDISQEERQLLKNLLQSNEGKTIITGSEPTSEESEKTAESRELEEILNAAEQETVKDTGLIDESSEKQGRLRLNLVIFILFLLAVIIWIFWVNRELIKERKEQNEKEDEKSKDKDQNKFEL